jgi:hypothetical protein
LPGQDSDWDERLQKRELRNPVGHSKAAKVGENID